MTSEEPVTGSCLCGSVRYTADKRPFGAHYCHCQTCRKASGAPVIAGAFLARSALRITRGEPKFFRSSAVAERGFCADCGTYLFYRPLIAEWSDWIVITIASLDRPGAYPPQCHYGTESRLPWFDTRDELPRESYEEGFTDILIDGSPEARQAILDRFG